jgi:CRP-like cAMP-binding protein
MSESWMSKPGMQPSIENQLLCAFSADERTRLRLSMQHRVLTLGQVLYESGDQPDHVYFPTTAVVSYLYTMREGSTAEIALVGNDGVVGMALFLGDGTNLHRAVVQVGGNAIKIPARVVKAEFARAGQLHHVLLRYTQALIIQISQTAVCNRLHSVEQRLCRWLLLRHDRVPGPDILMTQEYIGNMLGGRRESVTVAARHLQDAGLIQYSRGHIKLVNRRGLEAMACECYRNVEDELDRLLGPRQSATFVGRAVPYGEAEENSVI